MRVFIPTWHCLVLSSVWMLRDVSAHTVAPALFNTSELFNATASPAPTPTLVPTTVVPSTVAPTSSPPVTTTLAPSNLSSTTMAPTNATSAGSPTQTPTSAPNTTEPSAVLTAAPSATPTNSSVSPPPTPVVTGNVTSPGPSSAPTSAPTEQPSATAMNVTSLPTMAPSGGPSAPPTASPTAGLQKTTVKDLSMNLFGITSFPQSDYSVWEAATAKYQKQYYRSVMNSPVIDFNATVTITTVVLPSHTRGLRQLQSNNYVNIVYSQAMEYRLVKQGVVPTTVASVPFDNAVGRKAYLSLLTGTGLGFFTGVSSTSGVATGATPPPSPAPVASTSSPTTTPKLNGVSGATSKKRLGTGAIVGIAVGGGVALIGLLLFFFFRSGDNDYEGANDPPPSVSVKRGGDEVSTLAAPAMGRGPMAHESLAGYGDQSVATVDYDYSKAYGGGGDTSVSSAGGTFGSQTHGQSVLDPATAGATGAALGGAGSFSDTDSFEAAYRGPNANIKEELLNIFAPPGKLGVVIDTPDDGAPVVHAVKDSSVIADRIHVGDKLVAVDDEDVRSMTAIKVSKLISRKSANPSRKLTIIRTTVIE